MKAKEKRNAPKVCRTCGHRNDSEEKIKVSNLLKKTIESFEARMKTQDFKPTIAEYLKLVQLEQESEQETAKEIKVTWIDPTVSSDAEK